MPGVSFDRAASYYDVTRGYGAGSAERIRDAIVAYTGAGANTRFLELGVGTGRIALPFIQAGYDYTGVDISQAMMDQLRAKLASDATGAERLDLRVADVAALPFADANFDVIITVHVLHLVGDWQAVLREARRVLRAGGTLLIGYDGGEDAGQAAGAAAMPEPLLVREKWLSLRRELGAGEKTAGRANIWGTDPQLITFLDQLGARTEVVRLAAYERPPISPRAMAERLRERMYSSDWNTPADLHAEMLRRLDEWFAQTIAAPDTPAAIGGQFAAIAAVWEAE